MLLIYYSSSEVEKYSDVFLQRFMNTDLHGHSTTSYAS